ncbi:hypothetical protein F5050DRAFT_1711812 [Lentinula boryana]|uniref:Uncharacterized protein n=1 Tax=Lentinula boryana TaxID=40481 RepID=A0ABQ8QE39_9AGAR|nr:hypothetical protein F5050DRAFT_1711812 [Lentinula boryana]
MRNPPLTGVDDAVVSVSEEAKDILKSFLSRHADDDHVYQVALKNDYPFNQLGDIIYYSAKRRFLIDHKFPDVSKVYGWVLSHKDDQGKFHGFERSQLLPLPSPSETCMTCFGPHTGPPSI